MNTFERRYVFRGSLELQTALHIGGGGELLGVSDSPILRGPDGKPFIPGSSFKGAFRSTVEKLAGVLPTVRTCALTDDASCAGPQGKQQRALNQRRREERWDEARLVRELAAALCDTCKLFGSPYAASKLRFADLHPPDGEEPVTQVRDGVGIDRDSERAVEGIKFDFEVVERGTAFRCELILENPTPTDLGLTCLGISEYLAGFGGLGGKRSRGLGSCRLSELEIYELDLTVDDKVERARRLRQYLFGRAENKKLADLSLVERMVKVEDVDGFLQRHLNGLLAPEVA
jgi:CRISPR-associated RAMP protein (TIGR02581 family)